MSLDLLLFTTAGLEQTPSIYDIKPGFATLLSATFAILIATIGWWLSRRNEILTERNKQTLSYISVLKNKDREKDRDILKSHFQKKIKFKLADEMNDYEKKSLIEMLSETERQAACMRMGLLSEEFTILTEKSFLSSMFILSSDFIKDLRSTRKIQSVYDNYEMMFIRMNVNRSLFMKLYENITISPQYIASMKEFKICYFFAKKIYSLKDDYLDEDINKVKTYVRETMLLCYIITAILIAFLCLYLSQK